MLPPLLIPGSAVLLAVGLWLWVRWCYAQLIQIGNTIPSMHPPWPVLGHAHYCIRDLTGITKVMLEMSARAVESGHYTTAVWVGPVPFFFFHHPNDVKTLLRSSRSQQKFNEINLFRFALGDGLITSSGDLWRVKRRHLNPLFHPQNLDHMRPVFNTNSRQLVERLSERVDQGPLDILEYITDTTLLIICGVIFGHKVKIDMASMEFKGIKRVIKSNNSLYIKRLFRVWLRHDRIFQFLYRRELNEITRLVKAFTDNPLKVATKEDGKDVINHDKDNENEYLTLVNAYNTLQLNNPTITRKDLLYEIVTLYFTGSESVAVTVSSCLLALAQYQEIQEKLYQGIVSVVGLTRDVETDDLKNMSYLDQVIKETLRRFAIVPYIGRKTSDDVKLTSCTIPAGTTVFISILGSLMDPQRYPDPHQFKPERFCQDLHDPKGGDPLLFLPFSSGSRKCIGEQYSMLLMKTMIVHLVRRFRVSTQMNIHRLRRKLVVSLVSVDGYTISLTERG